ncbi:sugar ABC transporter permease [Streptomyces sp. Vc74B-19]|uniref:carbohydrate ABC transporter permease n=1 Tax=unclassified Streptomyces TaxID=2593676 RepID=UPI001BFCB1B0|nr:MULTISPECIES: sugar ABC transporter permease [unclassified Streptomyces]MBT3161560.1 sugar ABC transporter permease [Streptomyces sp. Vc74B-19]MCO4695863.1 sugar ABC transporter permease [Streptomyces sp. RO-S4]MDU0302085.1 sugar ABC transporter permease [Streptomyces sp. PAL114]
MTATGAQAVLKPVRVRAAAPAATSRRGQGLQHGGWFVAPFLALFALFVIWPLLRGLYLSFTDANISGDRAAFVGLDNYREALVDPLMWETLGHSAYFTLLVVPCITVLAFLLAMLAHHIERGKWLWRLCFFLPFLLPSTVAANLWQWLFNPGTGMVNHVLGLETPWLTDTSYAMLAVVITTLWWTVGFSFLLYLAALQGIPAHLYEAAALDGANAWHRAVRITLPLLRNITGLVVALQILASLQVFDQAVVMQDFGPGPEGSTRTFVQYTLEQGFTSYRVGYASAISIIFFVLIAAVALVRMWLLRSREEDGR